MWRRGQFSRYTKDMDLWLAPDQENLVRANEALPMPKAARERRDLLEAGEEVAEQIEKLTPLARTGEDDEFAGPAVFLASEAAGFITGVVLPVDGGYTAL